MVRCGRATPCRDAIAHEAGRGELRGYGWAGYLPGMRTVHYWGPPALAPGGAAAVEIAADRALRRERYIDCARQGDADLRAAVDTLRRLQPQVLVGFTQATAELARFVVGHGLRDWPPMRVVCGAERLFPEDRRAIEEAFGEPGGLFETYGCREAARRGRARGGHRSPQHGDAVHPLPARGPGRGPRAGALLVRPGAPAPSTRSRGARRISCAAPTTAGCPASCSTRSWPGWATRCGGSKAVQRRDHGVDLSIVPGPRCAPALLDGIERRLAPYLVGLPVTIHVVSSIPPSPSGKRRPT